MVRRQRAKQPLFPPLLLRHDKPARLQSDLRQNLQSIKTNEPSRSEEPPKEQQTQIRPVTSVKELQRPPTPEIREAIQPNIDTVEELDAFLDIEFDE